MRFELKTVIIINLTDWVVRFLPWSIVEAHLCLNKKGNCESLK